ncbi:MAG TPA: aminotransferase class V-fold PLP-dependent enzyme [Candidatus Eisenbacteria bacterium]|nr:aminotransferase class V-fold PLP-dependent enzyme [Candidatus Eisenbacteria bacterium]
MATTEPQRVAALTPPDPLLERLHQLEKLTAPLHPDAEVRQALTEAAFVHAEALNDELERGVTKAASLERRPSQPPVPIGPEAADPAAVFSYLVRDVDAPGMTPHAAGFFGYIPGGNLYQAAIADFLAAVSNRYTGHFLGGPGAVRVENQVLAWLASLLGYPNGAGGYLASGGSLATLSAIATAREAAHLRAEQVPRAIVYATDHVHHCVPKGLRIAGLGECPVRRVAMDAHYRMDPVALERGIEEDARSGRIPWLVVATAGTTDTGAVDPLDAIADVTRRHRLWLHVDGAYGAAFALCDEGKRILKGIERSDSVVINPHKGLFIPFGVGALLVKNAGMVREAHRFDATYVSDEVHEASEPSPCMQSPELSRPFRALRVWLPLVLLGTRPFAAALEEKLLLARYAHRRLTEIPAIETGPEPDLSVVPFRIAASDGADDERNRQLERLIVDDGRVFLSGTELNGRRWLRLAILASRTHRADVDKAIEVIAEKSRLV